MLEQLAIALLDSLILQNPDITKKKLVEILELHRLTAVENGDDLNYAICEEAFYMLQNNDFDTLLKEVK